MTKQYPQIVWLDYNSGVDFSEYTRFLNTQLVYYETAVECVEYIVLCEERQCPISLLISGDHTYKEKIIELFKNWLTVKDIYLITDNPPWAPPAGLPRHKKIHIIFNNVASVMSQLCRDLCCNDKCLFKTYSNTEGWKTQMITPVNDTNSRLEDSDSRSGFEKWDPILPHYTAESKIVSELGKNHLLYTDSNIIDPMEIIASFSSNGPVISQFEHIKSARDTYLTDEERYCDRGPVWRYPKIRGIFYSLNPLLERVGAGVSSDSLHNVPYSVFSLYDLQESTRDLTMEGTIFLWFQTMIDMLNKVPSSHKLARSDCIAYIQSQCDTKAREKELEKWTKEYQCDQALAWYTRATFLFHIVNEAMRRQNLEAIYKLRYFINHLCYQLGKDHIVYAKELNDIRVDSMMLYRGQLMSVTELEKIADNQRGFISLNTFTSASIDRDVALMFAADQQKIDDPNLRGVLFEIEIDISTADRARPFADITKHSDKKDENEVLFSIGSMFEIQTVKKLNSGTWSIKLKTIKSRPDGRVAELLAHFRRKVQMEQRNVSEFMWGRFFIEVGEYQTARSFYEHLIDHRPSHFLSDENTDDLSSMHNDLGFIHYQQEDYQKAIKHYSIALTHALARIPIWKLVSTGKHPYKTTLKRVAAGEAVSFPKAPYLQDQELDELATLYNNLAGAYDKIGECEHALTYLKKAVALESSCRNKNFDEKVEIANNIGLVQTHLGQLDSALRHCQMAMEWHSTRRYFDSPHKAIICLNIGNIYEVLNDSQHALEYYELALELVSKLLPPNHPLLLACLKKRNAIQEHIKTEKIKAEAERVKVAAAVAEKVAVAEKNRVAVAVTSSPQRTFIMQWHPPIRTANSVRTRCRNWQ